jgi:dihydrofolate synthase/folylpolyglutamate synthase
VNAAYTAALAYLYGLTDWERRPMDRSTRERLLLERPAALLARLGHPERRYRAVLVAGTKGKGSTAAMLASMLQAAGYRTGLYSQPHLHTYRERIRVDGVLIAPAEVAAGVARVRPRAEALEREQPDLGACTTYEVGTALALDHFARAGVAVAVLEVGLGGRLDATNVVDADLALVTSISFDHTAILGDTLPEIAAEKAGILKPGRPVLSAPQRPEALAVLEATAAWRGAPLGVGGRDWTWSGSHRDYAVHAPAARDGLWPHPWRHAALHVPLLGAHQLENAATAVAAAHALQLATATGTPPGNQVVVTPAAVARGLRATSWPARFEVVRPGTRASRAADGLPAAAGSPAPRGAPTTAQAPGPSGGLSASTERVQEPRADLTPWPPSRRPEGPRKGERPPGAAPPARKQLEVGGAGADGPETGGGPTVVVDGAHNGDSAARLAAALGAHLDWERLWLVVGAGTDKDLPAIIAPLAPLAAGAWAVASVHPRSRAVGEVAAALAAAGVRAHPAASVGAGLRQALAAAGPHDAVCVTGSLFVAAEAREALGLVPSDELDPAVS